MTPRLAYLITVAAVLFAALALRVWDPKPVARMRLLVFDTYQQLAPRHYDPRLPVRIADIDEESLRRLGQWPWPRSLLANLTQKLQSLGAAVIAFDLVFSEPDRLSPAHILKYWPEEALGEDVKKALAALPANDRLFADAIAAAPAVLGFIAIDRKSASPPALHAGFAFAGDDPKLFVPGYPGSAASLSLLQAGAKGSGALNWLPEHDQIIRRLPLLLRVGGTLYPSFAAEALRVAQRASTIIVKSSGASGEQAFGEQTGITHVRAGNVVIPTDANGQVWLHFTKTEPRRYIPAWRILDGKIGRDAIEGHIILIGTSAAGLHDLRATPLDVSIPGVEVHAQAIEQMMLGRHLLRPDFATGAELVYLLLIGVLIAWLIYVSGAAWGAVAGALSIAAVTALSWLAYSRMGWLADPVYPVIVLTVLYITGTVYLYLRTEAERNRVRDAFAHYMAPSLVEELAANPARLRLGGEMRELSLLFCDVRGFTAISEGLDAEELTRFINRLFTPLSNVILAQRGTIDKYMGDAIMAFWNAPLDDPDHPRNACRAALAMIGELERLNAAWSGPGARDGARYPHVRIGIGINTGPCCVGNLGSEKRFDYSVIGDNVNIAARLEGQTKTYGVPIILGEAAARAVPAFATAELDLVAVMGKQAAIRIFALLGDEAAARGQDFTAFQETHTAMLAAYRNRQWDAAEALLAECAQQAGQDLDRLYNLYRARIARFRQTPPPADWDGRVIADSK